MPHDQNQSENISRDKLLHAQEDEHIANTISEDDLEKIIQAELGKQEAEVDVELLNACLRLHERIHKALSEWELARSQKKVHTGLIKTLYHKNNAGYTKRIPLRGLAFAASILLIIFGSVWMDRANFSTGSSKDQQQYIVVGIGQNEVGLVRADDIKRDSKSATFSNTKEIAPFLGYDIALPQWLPEDLELQVVTVVTNEQADTVMLTYKNLQGSVIIDVTHYSSREGTGIAFEQDERGKPVVLNSGATVYVADNLNSVWGLYQSKDLDYFIDASGFDERTLIKIFNTIGDN